MDERYVRFARVPGAFARDFVPILLRTVIQSTYDSCLGTFSIVITLVLIYARVRTPRMVLVPCCAVYVFNVYLSYLPFSTRASPFGRFHTIAIYVLIVYTTRTSSPH